MEEVRARTVTDLVRLDVGSTAKQGQWPTADVVLPTDAVGYLVAYLDVSEPALSDSKQCIDFDIQYMGLENQWISGVSRSQWRGGMSSPTRTFVSIDFGNGALLKGRPVRANLSSHESALCGIRLVVESELETPTETR